MSHRPQSLQAVGRLQPGIVAILLGMLLCTPNARSQAEATEKEQIVMVGRDAVVDEGETIRSVVVVSGSATIKGTVRQDVVVVSGSVTVEGKIRGKLIVVAGNATLGPQAEVRRDLIVVGGQLTTSPTAKTGRHPVVVSPGQVGLGWLWGWLTQGLLLARPMPPQFLWAWMLAGVVLAGYILLALVFPRPVQACAEALQKRPLGSFFVGLLAFMLFAPLVVLLAISVIGIVIIPFLVCAMLAAFLFGKVAIYRSTGQQIGIQTGVAGLQQPLLALVLGAMIFFLLYTIPVIGFLVWGVLLPLCLGAAVLAFFRSFRSESVAVAGGTAAPIAISAESGSLGAGAQAGVPPLLLERVGFWRRLFATTLDFILFMSVLRLFRHHYPIFLLFWTAYHVAMWTWKGTTIGGVVMGIRIVRQDGRPVNFAVALIRALSSYFSAMALMIGFFWAGWSRDKQAWHDKIAGTAVVKGASLL